MTPVVTSAGARSIRAAFAAAADDGRAALVPYVMCGRPSGDACVELLGTLQDAGADIIELGLPFSDPIADGAVIRAAAHRALADGMTVAGYLDVVRRARAAGVTVPIICMGYVNPLLRFGLETFCEAAAEAGIDGLIIPDAAESDELHAAAARHGLGMTMLVTARTLPDRLQEALQRCTGFCYAVASDGTTGARVALDDAAVELARSVRAVAEGTPVAVGFGISTPAHVAALAPAADGVIVGSALVDLVDREGVDAAAARVRELRAATRR